MPWSGKDFIYTKRILRAIAENYIRLYDGLPLRFGDRISNPWALAEYKADFDMALSHIGNHWNGNIRDFKNYRHSPHVQQIIIADILGIEEGYLAGLGFYDIPRLKDYAYFRMTKFLNEGR